MLSGPIPSFASGLSKLALMCVNFALHFVLTQRRISSLSGSGVCGPLPGNLKAADGPVTSCSLVTPPPPPHPPVSFAPSPPGGGINWAAVSSAITNIYNADLRLAPTAIRLGFHVCGTFIAATSTSNSTGGCQVLQIASQLYGFSDAAYSVL